jgi:glycosyltransferase involved in cell wall biosynthesis
VRVALDASAAAKAEPTGVGRYVSSLAQALLEEDPSLELVLALRLGRWRRRRHAFRPSGAAASRARARWFPSFWPGLATSGCDVAHGPDARLVGGKAPQVVTVHDLFNLTSDAWAGDAFRAEKARRYAAAATAADRVLCVSEATARGVEERLGVPRARIAVTPLGVDPAFRPLPAPERDATLARLGVRPPYLLFVGLAQPRKNLEAVATVFARLSARLEELTLVVAGGDGYPEGRLATIWKETGAPERVRHLGYVGSADLPALYSGAVALLFPSRDEGFGLPALEAMACGCPVVASDRGALPEVVGPGGLLFAPDDVDGLEEAAGRLLDDEAFRRGQAERGLERARGFTWAATARATLAAYRDAASARNARVS